MSMSQLNCCWDDHVLRARSGHPPSSADCKKNNMPMLAYIGLAHVIGYLYLFILTLTALFLFLF